jgi:hypothetical protein
MGTSFLFRLLTQNQKELRSFPRELVIAFTPCNALIGWLTPGLGDGCPSALRRGEKAGCDGLATHLRHCYCALASAGYSAGLLLAECVSSPAQQTHRQKAARDLSRAALETNCRSGPVPFVPVPFVTGQSNEREHAVIPSPCHACSGEILACDTTLHTLARYFPARPRRAASVPDELPSIGGSGARKLFQRLLCRYGNRWRTPFAGCN